MRGPAVKVPSSSFDPAARTNQVRVAVAVIAGGLHVAQAALFAALGQPGMALASVISVLIFVAMFRGVRAGHGRAFTWLGALEMITHATWLSTQFGLASGYWIYLVLIAGGAHLAFTREERRDRVVLTLAPMALTALLFGLTHGRAGSIGLDARWVEGMAVLNVAGAFLGQVSIVAYAAQVVDRAEARAEDERARSEALLLNILPAPIAARLKASPDTISDAFDSATVLFADLVGFTTLSAQLPTHALIVMLNEIFSGFDALATEHGLEKIKTIGDAYMVVGGVPEGRGDHAQAVARMALAMRALIHARPPGPTGRLDLRIGIHSGPVVAGVIGTRKFSYDLWGDTVNTASRMESHSEPGRIQLSEATAALLGERFLLEPRGEIQVKGKGTMRTFFLGGERG